VPDNLLADQLRVAQGRDDPSSDVAQGIGQAASRVSSKSLATLGNGLGFVIITSIDTLVVYAANLI
jgi:hypothetical protein